MESLAHDTLAREAYARSQLAQPGWLSLPLLLTAGGLVLLALRHDPHGAGGVAMAATGLATLTSLAATRRRLRRVGLLLAALALLGTTAATLVGIALDGAPFLPAGASALVTLALASLAAGSGLAAGQR
jgi:hypothetical protein